MKYLLYYSEDQPFEESSKFEFVESEEKYIVDDIFNIDKASYSPYYLTYYNNELKIRNISFSYNVCYDITKEEIENADKLFKRSYNVRPIFLFSPIERKNDELYVDCFYREDISKYLFGVESKTRDPYFCITEYSVFIHNEMKNFDIKDRLFEPEIKTLCYSFDRNYHNKKYLVIEVDSEKDIRNDLLYRNKNYIEPQYFEFKDNMLVKHDFQIGYKKAEPNLELKTYVFSFDKARLGKNLYEEDYESYFEYIDVSTEEDVLDFIFYNPKNVVLNEFYIISKYEAKVYHYYFPFNFHKTIFLSDLSVNVMMSTIGRCFLNEDIANAFI